MKEMEIAVGALDMAKNIRYVGAARKQPVDGFDAFTLIAEGALEGFNASADVGSPRPDAGKVKAGVDALVVRAEEAYQISTPRRSEIGVVWTGSWTGLSVAPTRSSATRLWHCT
jgi:hypothetical protein